MGNLIDYSNWAKVANEARGTDKYYKYTAECYFKSKNGWEFSCWSYPQKGNHTGILKKTNTGLYLYVSDDERYRLTADIEDILGI